MTERRLKTNHRSEVVASAIRAGRYGVVANEGFAEEARGMLTGLGGNLRGRAS